MYALFFCRCASTLHKKYIICGMCQRIYKKVAHTQAFRTHFRLTWSPKPETGTRNPKPKPFKMRPSSYSSHYLYVSTEKYYVLLRLVNLLPQKMISFLLPVVPSTLHSRLQLTKFSGIGPVAMLLKLSILSTCNHISSLKN